MSKQAEFSDQGTASESATVAGRVLQDIIGDFELTPAIAKDKFVASAAAGDTVSQRTEANTEAVKADKDVAEKQRPPLTRTEAHLLRSLSRSLSDGDPAAAQELLGILADDHPNSIRRVLEELKYIKEASDDQQELRINWEQGTDRNNERFVRLYMTRSTPPSTRVEVGIGSDGRNQAVRHDDKTGEKENLSLQAGLEAVRPVEARRQLSVKQELLRKATERRAPQR
jgi:hypothetical protein